MIVLPFLAALAASAPVAESRVLLTGFDRVRVDGPFVVTVATGEGASGRVSGDPATLDRVRLYVEGSTVVVAPARDDRGRAKTGPLPVVALGAGRIVAVTVRGGGHVTVDRMVAPRVDIALTGDGTVGVAAIDADTVTVSLIGAGGVTLAGRATQGRMLVNGPGTIDAAALTTDELLVQSSGAGSSRYRARYAADIGASGVGSVVVDGTPRCVTRGTATIRCGDR